MTIANVSDRMIQAALDLAWSHWSALGVRGVGRPPDTAVDPEALIYFTAGITHHDPRLRDEVTDWWVRHQRFVSRPRLRRLAASFEPHVVTAFGAIDAQVGTDIATSGKSRLESLDLPSRAMLRLRCLFGANARAEVVLALLTQWADADQGVTASALAEVGFSKRNLAAVLDEMRLAGLVIAVAHGNRLRYRLADPDAMRAVVGPLPSTAGRWHARLPIISSFVSAAERIRGKEAIAQAAAGRKVYARHAPAIASLGLVEPRLVLPERVWETIQDWVVGSLMQESPDRSRALVGMVEGTWRGPRDLPSRSATSHSAVLPARGADLMRDTEVMCLDLVQVWTVSPVGDWTWAVLSEAAIDTYDHTAGMRRGERWFFVAPDERGNTRVHEARYAAPLPPDQIAQRYGAEVASRARPDRPAVQLVLRQVDVATMPRTAAAS